jgi:multisubunit Na+/H+ antiporter MnhB subunit
MSGLSIALSLPKSKRKRKRPLSPRGWAALGACVLWGASAILNFLRLTTGEAIWHVFGPNTYGAFDRAGCGIMVAVGIYFISLMWPILIAEIKKMDDD